MKYLKIHIVIAWLLVLLYTLTDAIMWAVGYIVTFLWNFNHESISKSWKVTHTKSGFYNYSDDNIIQSFNRRWKEIKEIINQ